MEFKLFFVLSFLFLENLLADNKKGDAHSGIPDSLVHDT